MFIPDFPHQLLQNIFQSYNAHGSSKLIDYHRNMHLIFLKFLQEDVDFLTLSHIQRRSDNGLHAAHTAIHLIIKVLLVNDPYNVVDLILIDGETGVSGLAKHRRYLLFIRIDGNSCHIDTRGCDIHGFQLCKFNGALDQASFLFINPAILFRLLHDSKQLLLRNAGISRSPDQD